ncbi:hypothetical protein JL2886_02197 [Phaeobacter gallaeciensis]|uniref:Uncharacterized protein n=1 Tax=Phaeobacter gallaeciensis TaxID=60890 RepID=A0A1B0ZSP0_9RHOB|nr:hypothetical protein JL2886_02197 [Phaeobacter gallaeciensis]
MRRHEIPLSVTLDRWRQTDRANVKSFRAQNETLTNVL